MDIVATAGAVENAKLLAEGQVQAALLQGGVEAPEHTDSLGAVFFEPVFVFANYESEVSAVPATWTDLRIAAGGPGSGTQKAVAMLAEAAEIDVAANSVLPLGGEDAVEALLRGDVDIAIFVAPLAAPYLQPLFAAPAVELLDLPFAEAVSRRMLQSRVLTLPAGSVSMNLPIPATATEVLALVAQMIAVDGIHPSLVDRLVEAARIVHSDRDAITKDISFTVRGVSLPVNAYAQNLIRDGTSPLQQYLPYWVVAQINRFAILLLPIIFLLVPLLRSLPGVYAWRMRRRVDRYYDNIRNIDVRLHEIRDPVELQAMDRQLEEIDRNIVELKLPLPYSGRVYNARLHVDLVRRRIGQRLAECKAA
jgi:hypothetical protein